MLIALGIIGIVAALTMPSLVANYKEKATVTQLKKFYSVMAQAYSQAIAENGDPTGWDLFAINSLDGANNIVDKLAPYLKIVSRKSEATAIIQNTGTLGDEVTLADGSVFRTLARSADCTDNRGNTETLSHICGGIVVDINGSKAPNKYGQDVFYFIVSKDRIIPCGTKDEITRGFDNNCKLKPELGCTAWVIYNENMDYLRCGADLSWDGPTKCSN